MGRRKEPGAGGAGAGATRSGPSSSTRGARLALVGALAATLLGVGLLRSERAATLAKQVALILQLGAGFTARTLCTGIFLSKRSLDSLQHELVAGGKVGLLFFPTISHHDKKVKASFLGLGWLPATARFRSDALGCYLLDPALPPPTEYNNTSTPEAASPRRLLKVDINPRLQELLLAEVSSPEALLHNQTRALVVVHKGAVVGEVYQQALGIGPDTRLLAWSMSKTVHALAIGAAMHPNSDAGISVGLDTPVQLPHVDDDRKRDLLRANGGKNLTFRDLMGMSDVLEMAEEYGLGADVPTMLFTAAGSDAGRFASTRRKRQLHRASPSSRAKFGWLYSSGLSNVLASEFRRLFPSTQAYYDFFFAKFLHGKIGGTWAFETDSSGTFLASSFVYATARDFARLAKALLEHHSGASSDIWPAEEFLNHLQTPHPESGGLYSSAASVWLNPARVSVHEYNSLLHSEDHVERFRWMTQVLPSDCYSLSGFQGQMVLVCPSLDLAVVRLGLTPASSDSPSASDVQNMATSNWSKARLLSGILSRLDIDIDIDIKTF